MAAARTIRVSPLSAGGIKDTPDFYELNRHRIAKFRAESGYNTMWLYWLCCGVIPGAGQMQPGASMPQLVLLDGCGVGVFTCGGA